MISLKSVSTEAVDTEDFVLLKVPFISSFLSECKDNLKFNYDQRKPLVLIELNNLVLVYVLL
mgnify:CR=1 FL=1